jgi:hypothetical protein
MSGITFSCTNCSRLGECVKVDEEKLLTDFYCGDWKEAHEAVVAARKQILYKFGSAGATSLLNRPPAPTEEE